MWVQVTCRACVLRVGQVTAEFVWRSITVSRRVEEAAAATQTVTTSDPVRLVGNSWKWAVINTQ